jgi:hypothetical protein
MSGKDARSQIERAMRMCEGMDEVRAYLAGALRKLDEREKKEKKSAARVETPLQKWVFDAKAGTFMNMGRNEAMRVLGRLEGMIADEKRTLSDEGEQELMSE